MDAGISQENGAAQDITFDVGPGEVFVVPQGLLHYNHNDQCFPNVFLQSFTSSDPGALNVIGALAATVSYTHLRAPRDRTRSRMPSSA